MVSSRHRHGGCGLFEEAEFEVHRRAVMLRDRVAAVVVSVEELLHSASQGFEVFMAVGLDPFPIGSVIGGIWCQALTQVGGARR
jgi:hypothetical protein